jgi:acyl-CoA reductase-like NAD-dependent aldehyde dehydrogenase
MDLSNTPNRQLYSQNARAAETAHETDLHRAFERLRAAYAANRMPSVGWRRQQLSRLEAMLRDNISEICEAIAADFGHRSHHETQLLELFPAIAAIKHARRHVGGWMKPRRSWASMWFLPARNEIRPQPLGVVGIIVPWNYPILLAVAPLVGALAAGNRAFIKMSEFTPRTGKLFATLIETYFTSDEVLVVNGEAEVAQAFSTLTFDHLLFTGSTAIGKRVMQAAAEHLTPVTLELGGKSPALIGPDAEMTSAVSSIMFGKCLNAGQTCIAPDYVLLPRGKEGEFIEAAKRFVSTHYPAIAANADYTSLVNQRHLSRLHGYLDEARAAGASVYGLNGTGENLEGTQKLAPTIVTGATDDCRLLQEEIFGPILPLIPYDGLDSAISYINARPRPLALYYFGHDRQQIDRVLDETVAGGVSINETLLHISQEDLPFGGVGPSGMGAYHGKVGFDTFSKSKPIFHQSRFNGLAMFQPPFGKRFEALIKFLLK